MEGRCIWHKQCTTCTHILFFDSWPSEVSNSIPVTGEQMTLMIALLVNAPAQTPSLLGGLVLSLHTWPAQHNWEGGTPFTEMTMCIVSPTAGIVWFAGSGDSSLLHVFTVPEVFLIIVFTPCLTCYMKILFPPLYYEFLHRRESAFFVFVSC